MGEPLSCLASALSVTQMGIAQLMDWADLALPSECSLVEALPSIQRAKAILGWSEDLQVGPLRLIFDQIALPEHPAQTSHHWCPQSVIDDDWPRIPYPLDQPPSAIEQQTLQERIRSEISPLLPSAWNNLSLLTLILIKYGSGLSLGAPDVALVDLTRTTAALAAALAHDPDAEHVSLIAGDLSGIQSFIYTISSAGALKSLRARSFYLELVTEEIVQTLLSILQLPASSVIYAGGGNLYLLAPSGQGDTIKTLRRDWNQWLFDEFQGKIFLSLTSRDLPTASVGTTQFSQEWTAAIQTLQQQKQQKFEHQVETLLTPRPSHPPCQICHRDDLPPERLGALNREPDAPTACPTCQRMYALGSQLFKIKTVIRSADPQLGSDLDPLTICVGGPAKTIHYHLFENASRVILKHPRETVFLINNWSLKDYQFGFYQGRAVPLLLGNYFQTTQSEDQTGFMPANEMADLATADGCIGRVGYLRMDVDRLGQLFAKGLGAQYSLPRLAGLSRHMSYFFKTYLNSLAQNRQANLPLKSIQVNKSDRPHLLFIYAGGDDLFVSGAWHHVLDFALDVYQSFRAYTGHHPAITLSAGLSLAGGKYPLYQAAAEAGDREHAAKGNGRDSLGLFDDIFKWSEWLGTAPEQPLNASDHRYLAPEIRPPLLGVLPLVQQLLPNLQVTYSQGFIRNLLTTAKIREQRLRDLEQTQDHQRQAITYYLHLPQLAYTLSRLPQTIKEDEGFSPVRESLMNPRNSPYFRAIATWIEYTTRTR